ncbi:MAG: hypothetical protein HKN58_06390 [Xanthomonadales bacterium]|nr:hypothetical protein [Xanthomonadales bacterium]
MNRIQKLSQDILSQRLKLLMGLDPELDIEPQMLQAMWAELQRERRMKRTTRQADDHSYTHINRAA